MATLSLWARAEIRLDGEDITFGSMVRPVTRTLTQCARRVITVAASTTVEIFDASTDAVTDFDFLWLASDYDLRVEFTTDLAADVGTVISTMTLRGTASSNKYGFPLILGDDASFANHTANFATGTIDVIDRIRVKNESSTQAVQLLFGRGT